MRRLLLPAALAAGMLAALTGAVRAHGGGAFGFGLSVQLNVTYWGWYGQPGGGPGGCCDSCFIPGWSPCYDAPKMFGGMRAAGYNFNPAPLYPGTIKYPGGYDAVGYVPQAYPGYHHGFHGAVPQPVLPPVPDKMLGADSPAKVIENAPPPVKR